LPKPDDIRVIDTMIGLPDDLRSLYDGLQPALGGRQQTEKSPISYLFRNAPQISENDDLLAFTLAEMDRFGIQRAMLQVDDDTALVHRAFREYPERFFADYLADPNKGMVEVRKIERMKREFDIKAVSGFPCGLMPQVPVGDRRWYPIYAKCIELDIAFIPMMGVPGPRLPFAPQDVAQLDELCYFFPELTIVTRHGCEPWVDLMVKLMLKWPNLYYSTTAFAPKHYPRAIIDYANTRGADKVIYGGYSPFGVSIERSFTELGDLPLRDHVWAPFLRDNAIRVFGLGQ
jgi:predicted TIM-barrel fold metal-dependent hydrolase